METEERTDIDLSGSAAAEEDVFADVPAEEDPGRITPAPPGVAEGTLGGEGATIGEEPAVEADTPDEPETPSEDPVAAEEEQLPIDTGQGDPNEGDPNPVEEPAQPPAAAGKGKGHTGGSPEREYLILEEVEVKAALAKELDLPPGSGVLYVPRTFGDGRKVKTIKARNADTALRAVGRLEEIGYDARVVAISAGFFQPRRVRNKPREGAEVEIGGE